MVRTGQIAVVTHLPINARCRSSNYHPAAIKDNDIINSSFGCTRHSASEYFQCEKGWNARSDGMNCLPLNENNRRIAAKNTKRAIKQEVWMRMTYSVQSAHECACEDAHNHRYNTPKMIMSRCELPPLICHTVIKVWVSYSSRLGSNWFVARRAYTFCPYSHTRWM